MTLVADLAARFIRCRARLESLPSLNWQNDLAALAPLALLEWCPYFVEMQINSKRLTEDCAKAQVVLAASGRAHCGTGATAIIEPALPLIRDLRRQKHSWSAIAAALGRQGVVQGADRQPITPRRLTALIAAIEKRGRRRTERQRGRCMRQDLAHHGERPSRLILSGDLADMLPSPTASDDSEERIRREALEGLQTLLKKG